MEFTREDFVAEFAYRTKLNYLLVKEKSEAASVDEIEKQREQLRKDMKERQFIVDEAYEITQLINSMLGLLVFPQQRFFNAISKTDFSDMPTLEKYVRNKMGMDPDHEHFNTIDCITAANTLRHLRNAVSHERLHIHPEPFGAKLKPIERITFQDTPKDSKKIGFSITFKAEDLENILFDISDMIIRCDRYMMYYSQAKHL